MHSPSPFDQWKESSSGRTRIRDNYRGMHLDVLQHAVREDGGKGLLSIRFESGDLVLCEIRGRAADLANIELPVKSEGMLCLCLQFLGKLTLPEGYVSVANTYFIFVSSEGDALPTVPADKVHALFLGVSGASQQQLLSEYPLLRQQYDQQKRMKHACGMTYMERRYLENFATSTFGPFSTMHHIGQLYSKLYASYTHQLSKQHEHREEEASVMLYHRAVDYVYQHYMEADINRHVVADALHCSTRNLSRAFEGRSQTLSSTIILLRLHKARELLHQQPNLSIDDVAAMLHFPNAKHFATQYKKCFHRSPRTDRKSVER